MLNRATNGVFILAVIGSLVLLNVLGLRVFGRLDVTRDKAFTLAQATRETLSKLEDPIKITAYFTDKLPAPYSSNARYVRDLLDEYRAASGGKVAFEMIDPMAQETAEDKEAKRELKQDIFGRRFREPTSVEKELAQAGVQPVEIRVIEEDQVQTKRAYMGLLIRHGEKKEVIPVVQEVRSLEYNLTTLIRKLVRARAPVVAILTGHGEPALNEKLTELQTVLSESYEVRSLDLTQKEKVDDDVDALFVLGPARPLAEKELKAIDQFLMRGKSAAFFPQVVQVDAKTFQTQPASHGLKDLLATYGVTLKDELVADAEAAQLSVQERRGFMIVTMPVPYPFVPIVQRLQSDSPISKGLGNIVFPFVTPVSATAAEGRTVAVLANSSKKSWLEPAPYNVDPRRDWRAETITPTGPYPLMVQVSGKLKSHYASEATASGSGITLAESQGESRLVVAGGGALFLDEFMNGPNQALALNLTDWLLLDPALLAMRTRSFSAAPIQEELSAAARNGVKLGNSLGIPLLLAAYGVVRWRMREARRSAASV